MGYVPKIEVHNDFTQTLNNFVLFANVSYQHNITHKKDCLYVITKFVHFCAKSVMLGPFCGFWAILGYFFLCLKIVTLLKIR